MRYRIIKTFDTYKASDRWSTETVAGFFDKETAIAVCKRIGDYVIDALTGETLYKC